MLAFLAFSMFSCFVKIIIFKLTNDRAVLGPVLLLMKSTHYVICPRKVTIKHYSQVKRKFPVEPSNIFIYNE